MFRHILPNAMVATLTFLPFLLCGAVTTLTALDFLGFGLPPGSPSLGELVGQGRDNLQAPWLGLTVFVVLATLLSLLVFTFKVKISEKMHAEIVEQLEAKLTAGEVSDEEAKTVETVEAVNEKAKTLTE